MSWHDNVAAVTNKANESLFFMRKLKQANVDVTIITSISGLSFKEFPRMKSQERLDLIKDKNKKL